MGWRDTLPPGISNHAHAELIDVEAERDVGFATKGAVTLG